MFGQRALYRLQQARNRRVAAVQQREPPIGGGGANTLVGDLGIRGITLKLPADLFVQMQDELVKELYGGDPMAFWHIGVKSGQFAVTQGQLKGLFKPEETRRFILFTPHIYRGYFDGGELTATPRGEVVEIAISGVPPHIYFEYSILGFLQGGLQALDPKAAPPRRVKGFSKGDDTVLYEVTG